MYKKERRTGLTGDVGLSLAMGTFKQRADLPTDLGSFFHNVKVIPMLNLNHNTSRARTCLHYEALIQNDLPNNEGGVERPDRRCMKARSCQDDSPHCCITRFPTS